MPGELPRSMVNGFIVGSKIVRGELELLGPRVDDANVHAPFLHVAALYEVLTS